MMPDSACLPRTDNGHLGLLGALYDKLSRLKMRPAGAVSMAGAWSEVKRLEETGVLHAADLPGVKDMLTTEKAAAAERETIALVEAGRGRGAPAMRAGW